jgi:alanyl-tRNA synthetase
MTRLQADGKITALTTETELVQALTDGETGTIVTDETPFYGNHGRSAGRYRRDKEQHR